MSGSFHYKNGISSPKEKESKAEPVRTLFVRGLPLDVKPREMYNLFRPYQGFQNASLSYPGEQNIPVSFVSFSDHNSALAAMEQLQGLRFDPDSNTRLRIELAKSNSKTKKRNGFPLKEKEATESHRSSDSEGTENSDNEYSDMNDETVRSIFNYLYSEDELSTPPRTNGHTTITKSQPNLATNAPCSTIFLGNFHAINRMQLESALQSSEGFVRLKVSQKDNSIMCWADYKSVDFSTQALHSIEELNFAPTPGKEVRIEYARNPMGTPKKTHTHSM